MPDRILVVEDDVVVAETLEAYLQRAGYDVRVVRDGRQGLALASAGTFALVILDLMIPGLSGLDVCRELRKVSRVPVLMLTARTTEDDRVRGFERGADDYVAARGRRRPRRPARNRTAPSPSIAGHASSVSTGVPSTSRAPSSACSTPSSVRGAVHSRARN
jgi:CheY-like chemotaxis protein